MRVLFIFGGLPHYYNKILNNLNKDENLTISVLVPATQNSAVIGKGVYQTEAGIEFTVFQLQEYKTITGKSFFKGFNNFLKQNKPDAIVVGWPYIIPFSFDIKLRFLLNKLNIKLICKDIPFQVPKYTEAKHFYWNYDELNEELLPAKHSRWVERLKYFLLTQTRKMYYRQADAHVDYIEEAYEIIGSYGVKKESIFIIYNSPDTDALFEVKSKIINGPSILNQNKYRIIHVGRLVKWKRVDLLIQAVSVFKQKFPEIELVVIGTGPEKDNLVRQSKSLNIADNVKFVGGVYDNETLGKYLLESSIYVLAGMGGLSINDAMCFGKPIICSVCDGTEKKLVRDNVNGFIFKNGNVEDLISKMDILLSNPELLIKMGEMSVSIIKNEVNVDVVISNYKKAFEYVRQLK
jgi:glycosyltransferase involved in cell wall biosynthesis